MAVHAHKTDPFNELNTNNPFLHLFSSGDAFWWQYRSFAKALMNTHAGASACLEANRKLMDEILDFVRKEQDLSLEISTKMMKGLARNGGPATRDASEMSAMLDQTIENVRHLGEAWMDAQMRSLEVMRQSAPSQHASVRRKAHSARRSAH
jgi:hypothetical protein